MIIAIVGASGTVGAEAARELAARGHDVRVLGRRPVARALAGVDVVVDATQGTRHTARLLRAEAAAGVAHHVGLSSVGVDRVGGVGGGYFRAKLDQEAEIRRSGLPWTIVRATQFHSLVARTFAASARLGVVPVVRACLQPVDPREVARALADTAEAEPSYAITQFAGPEVLSVTELAWRWRAATGSHALPVRLPASRSLRAGGLTNPGAWRGRTTFDAWLAS